MITTPYTIPPDTRTAGSGNPPVDMDDVSDVLTGMGAGFSVLNTAFAGGADPTGVNDSTAAIQAALNACPPGGRVTGPPGATYKTLGPETVPPQVTLDLGHSSHIDSTPASIVPDAAFVGAAVILLVDQATGGYAIPSNQQRIRNVTIDCSNLTGSAIDGIQAQGFVHGVILEDVQIRHAPNHGLAHVGNGSGVPYSWRGTRVVAFQPGSHGFSIATTDNTWIDMEAIGCGGNGLNLAGSAANSHFTNFRAEFCLNGISLSGAWGTGTGSGGVLFSGCSTDRNTQNGISITATGTVPVAFSGLMLRRDGRNGNAGGGGYAGFSANGATLPIVVDGLTVFPGVDDDGTGTASPQIGATATSCSTVVLASGYVQGATSGIVDGGSNTALLIGPQVVSAHGTTSAPTLNVTPFLSALNAKSVTLQSAAAGGQLLKITGTASGPTDSLVKVIATAAGDNVQGFAVTGDTFSRYKADSTGLEQWGDGTGATDANLYRASAALLAMDGGLTVGGQPVGPLTSAVPAGAIAETIPRCLAGTSSFAPATGNLYIYQVDLVQGVPVTYGHWVSGTTGSAAPANWWYVLLDNTFHVVAVTADQATTAIPASTDNRLAWGSVYTPGRTGQFYLGVMVKATSMPTSAASASAPAAAIFTALPLGGLSGTGQTAPPAIAAAMATPSAATQIPYMYLS